jgi:nitroreductase
MAVLVLPACSSSQRLVQKNTDVPFPLSAELKEVLYYASLAPNGHNTQMWKVGVSSDEKTIRLYLDSSRLLPVVDPEGRESLISSGAFIHNLTTALDAYGYQYSVQLAESVDIHANPLVAEILITGKTESPPDSAALATMEKRHTIKGKYLARELDGAAVTDVLRAAENRALFFPKGSPEYEFIQQQSIIANELQSASPEARVELAQWMRFSDEEAREKADGLPAEQLGMKGITKTFFYALFNREKAASEKFGKTSFKKAKAQLEQCAGFFVITGGSSAKDHLEAGIAMEAVWLGAVNKDIAIHPMSQALEEKETREAIAARFPGTNIHMIMRAGYVKDYGTNLGVRRPLREFVFAE